jgi:hypothetical protein
MNMSVPTQGLTGAQLTGMMSFGLDSHDELNDPRLVHQQQRQQMLLQPHHHQHQLEASIIDSISTNDAVLQGTSLWGDHRHGSTSVGGSSLLDSLLSSSDLDRGETSSLFVNQPVQQDQPQEQHHLNEGLWGNGSSRSFQAAPGRGSIW